MQIYCKKCEAPNEDTALFCNECGNSVAANVKPKDRPIPYLSVYAAAASTMAIVVSCYSMFRPAPEDIDVSGVSATTIVADRVVARQFLVVSPSGNPSGGIGWTDSGDLMMAIDNGQSQFAGWVRANGAVDVVIGDEKHAIKLDANETGAMVAVSHDGKRTATLLDVPGASGLQLHDSTEEVRGGLLVGHETEIAGLFFQDGKGQETITAESLRAVRSADGVKGILPTAARDIPLLGSREDMRLGFLFGYDPHRQGIFYQDRQGEMKVMTEDLLRAYLAGDGLADFRPIAESVDSYNLGPLGGHTPRDIVLKRRDR